MKIILEFETTMEHDMYVRSQAAKFQEAEHEGSEDTQVFEAADEGVGVINEPQGKIDVFTKRRHWSDYELQFLTDYYMTKKTRWIAKQLNRKPMDVNNKLTQLYKKGLPRKNKKSSKVREE